MHHIPSLFLHPSRRIRLLAIGLHTSILQIPALRTQLFFHLREVVSPDQAESILGSWCLVVHDIDRQVSSYAREAWNRYVSITEQAGDRLFLDSTLLPRLWEFIQRTLLDPLGVYLYINPSQPTIPITAPGMKVSGRGTSIRKADDTTSPKADEEEEKEQDRKARLRVSAFRATEWVLSGCYTSFVDCMYNHSMRYRFPSFSGSLDSKYTLPDKAKEKSRDSAIQAEDETETSSDGYLSSLANPALWSSLYHGRSPPFVKTESFGFEQPVVRRSAWSLLQTLARTCKGMPLR